MQKPTSDNDRSECLKKAESCLEQAGQDVSRRSYWIAQAAEWIRRARGGSEPEASSKICDIADEISDGRLIPKSTAE